MSKASWINTVLSWIAKKRGFSLKPITKLSTETASPLEHSTRSISGNPKDSTQTAYNLYLSSDELGEFPVSFTSARHLSDERKYLINIGVRISLITGTTIQFNQHCIGGPKLSYPISCFTMPRNISGTMVGISTIGEDGKKRCRMLEFHSTRRLLIHLIENNQNKPAVLSYYLSNVRGQRPFFFQYYRNGIISND